MSATAGPRPTHTKRVGRDPVGLALQASLKEARPFGNTRFVPFEQN